MNIILYINPHNIDRVAATLATAAPAYSHYPPEQNLLYLAICVAVYTPSKLAGGYGTISGSVNISILP